MVSASSQTAHEKNSFTVLNQFSEAVQALSARVAPGVVQISVTRYGRCKGSTGGRTGVVLGRLQSVGSGVIIDPHGYIVTNAHVVAGAQSIRVHLIAKPTAEDAAKSGDSITSALAEALVPPLEVRASVKPKNRKSQPKTPGTEPRQGNS